MKYKKILTVLLLSYVSFTFAQEKVQISMKSFNDNWEFTLSEFETQWQDVKLPHTAKIESIRDNKHWEGSCRYKKEFKIPEYSVNSKYFIKFEAAMNHATVWINDKYVKEHKGGYLPFTIDITKYARKGINTILIKLKNTYDPTIGAKPYEILDFNTYSGIYRNAWFITKGKIHITDSILTDKTAGGGIFITTPEVSKKQSVVNIKSSIINETSKSKKIAISYTVTYKGHNVANKISDYSNVNAGKENSFNTEIPIKDAKLWSPEHPNLYCVKVKVLENNAIVDSTTETFGIRQFIFKNHKLYINGKRTYLRGVNRHQEFPYVGYAAGDNAQYRDAYKIKQAGFNFIRTSHYPQSPAFISACDKLGIVIIDAIYGWQYFLENKDFKNYCYTSAHNLIRRDRNHPCVLAWEVSLNETHMPMTFMQKMNNIVHSEYPGKYIYSCGWKYPAYDIYLQARQHRILLPDKIKFDKPYIVSEYGDWEYYSKNAGFNQDNEKGNTIEKSSRQFRTDGEKRMLQQVSNVQEALNSNMGIPAAGDGYWVMYDYRRGCDTTIEASGLMDIFRIPKFAYYFYQSQQDATSQAKTILYIASYWNKESSKNVKVFSNCDKVSLYLDDKLIATQIPDKGKNCNNLPHAPFTFNLQKFKEGTLKAIGYINNKKVKTVSISTPEKPTKLLLSIDKSGISPKGNCKDIVFLYIKAIDKNGTVCPNFNMPLEVKTGNNVKVINTDPIKAEAGIATVVLEIGKTACTSNISATSSNNLKGKISLNIE